jgi:hypothetical protein
LGQIRFRRGPWRTPKCSHGSSLFLVSLSSTMWRHNFSSKIGQTTQPNAVQPWQHVCNLPFRQAKHP